MRSNAREAAFQVVYARLLGGDCTAGYRSALYKQAKLNEEEREFAEKLLSEVAAHEEEIARRLGETVTRFADYRIYPTDKAILYIALAEIFYFDDIPPVVSASEAASIARKYSTEKSADFVNGVLGGVINA